MQKAILILLLATLVVSKSIDSYVVSPSSLNAENASSIASTDFSEALSYIFGSVQSKRPSESTIDFIKKVGKTSANIFNPTKSGLLVLLHGDFNAESQQNLAGSSAAHVPINFENDSSLFSSIFGSSESLVNSATFSKNNKKEIYLFSQDNDSSIFQNFGVSLAFGNGKVNISEKQTGKVHKGQDSVKCVQSILSNGFELKGNKITDSTSKQSVEIQEPSFFLELCSMQTIINSFSTSTPSFVVLELSALKKIQETMSESDAVLAQRIVAHVVKKVVSHFEKIQKESTFSQVFFVNDAKDIFSGDDVVSFIQKRNLAIATQAEIVAANGYTLRAWFSIFFVALIFFTLYALFNVEIVKDSLLYAKFLTDERK